MKHTVMAIAIASIFAACNSKPEKAAETTVQTDTSAVNSLNDQSELIVTKAVPDTIVTTDGSKFARVQPGAAAKTVTHTSTSKSKSSATKPAPRSTTGTGSSAGTGNTGTGNSSTTSTTTTKKTGWSKAAKGTVIGAGAGAVTGAIISKKKGKGAVIGGLIGAGGGYIIGRKEDKKDGRVQ